MRSKHATHYLSLLASLEDSLTGRAQPGALVQIETEIGNVRAAWQWAIAHRDMHLIAESAHALWLYFVIRGQMREAAESYGMVLDALEQDPTPVQECPHAWRLAYAKSMTRCGGFSSGLGRYDTAHDLLTRGIALLRELGARREVGLALNMKAALCEMTGERATAMELLEESLAEFRAVGDNWGIAFSLNDLGLFSYLVEEHVEADWYCQQSHAMFREIGDQRGQAFAAFNLGRIAARRGDFRQAQRLYEESLSLRTGRDDRWGIAASMVQLASVLHATGQVTEAREMLVEALDIAWQSSVTPVVIDALVELAALELHQRGGDQQHAKTMLAAIAEHPATPGPVLERVGSLFPADTLVVPFQTGDRQTWAVRTVDNAARTLVS